MDHAFRVLGRSLNDLFRAIGPLIVVNLLWLALTLPLITAPPALAGLYHFAALTVRGHDPPVSRFFEGFRHYFWPSWALVALNLGLLALLLVNFVFYLGQPNEWVRIVAIPMFYLLLLWLGVQTYLLPLMVLPELQEGVEGANGLNPLPLFKRAIRLALAEPLYTLLLALAVLLWLIVNSALAGPILALTAAGVAVIRTRATLTVLGREPGPLTPGWKV